MVKVISVKFRGNCRSYYFDPGENDIRTGDGVIVETVRGEEYGDVTEGVKELEEVLVPHALKPVIRVATEEDKRMRREFAAKESEAFVLCQDKITDHKLDMKLVDVEYSYNGSKVVFYFTADERVDFRDLVKDLAYALRTRIELRQIGVRDEAKMLGGLGPCGRPVCCNAFLDDFRPVSIKMAKEQNLSLSPTKISGLCGRLMCCLQYEQYAYEEAHKRLPRVGKELETPEGTGVVTECNVLTERVKVRLPQEDGSFEIKEFACADVGEGTSGKKPAPAQAEAGEQPAAEPVGGITAAPEGEKKPERAFAPREKRPRREKPRREMNAEGTVSGSEEAPEETQNAETGEPEKKQYDPREKRSRHDRPRRDTKPENAEGKPEEAAAENGGEAKPAEERKDRREFKDRGRRDGRNRSGNREAGENTQKEENGAAGNGENAPHRENNRNRHRNNKPAGEKPEGAAQGEKAGNTKGERFEKRDRGERRDRSESAVKTEKRESAAEAQGEPAVKQQVTRLPGETIGLGAQEQSEQTAKPAFSAAHRSNLHRKHSFGPKK